MKLTKKTISNILFFGFIIFLFTPFGLSTKAKLTQGITYIKTLVMPPSIADVKDRKELDTTSFQLKGITNVPELSIESLKGKVVFINYWATWCGPCIAEMPMIDNLYNDYKDKVEFVFITSDDKNKVEKFYANHNYDFPTFNMISNPPKQIETSSIPATFILDKNTRVALSEFGPADWNNSKVRKLLDKLINE